MQRKARFSVCVAATTLAGLALAGGARTAAAVDLKNVLHRDDKSQQAFVHSEKWEGYVRDDKGREHALLEPIERNDDKDWMFLQFTPFSGPKQRIAIMQVENKAPNAFWLDEIPLSALEELLTTALVNTNRFEVIERKKVSTVFQEQDLEASGRITKQTAVARDKGLGVDYLIFVAVNEWTPNKGGVSASPGDLLGKLGHIGAGKTTSEVAISFRMVDATTESTAFSETVRAGAGAWNLQLGGILGRLGSSVGVQKGSPIHYSFQACANKAAYLLARSIKERAWFGTVANLKDDKVYISTKGFQGLQEGMKLTALSKDDEIADPDTGQSLGPVLSVIGTLQVTSVTEKLAVATRIQGCEKLKVGDRVQMEDSKRSPAGGG